MRMADGDLLYFNAKTFRPHFARLEELVDVERDASTERRAEQVERRVAMTTGGPWWRECRAPGAVRY